VYNTVVTIATTEFTTKEFCVASALCADRGLTSVCLSVRPCTLPKFQLQKVILADTIKLPCHRFLNSDITVMARLYIYRGLIETRRLVNQYSEIKGARVSAFLTLINETQDILQNLISWRQIYKSYHFENINYDFTVPGSCTRLRSG
jgi:hypothetical protein